MGFVYLQIYNYLSIALCISYLLFCVALRSPFVFGLRLIVTWCHLSLCTTYCSGRGRGLPQEYGREDTRFLGHRPRGHRKCPK